MLKKDIKKRIWCHQEPVQIKGCPVSFIFGKRDRNKVYTPFAQIKLPNKVKCPDCGKRFSPRVRQCHDENCWHIYIPAHKKEIKIKKNKK